MVGHMANKIKCFVGAEWKEGVLGILQGDILLREAGTSRIKKIDDTVM